MKQITLLIIFMISIGICSTYAQYFKNDKADSILAKVAFPKIKKGHKKVIVLYNKDLKLIFDRSKINYLKNLQDSLQILKYVINNDSILDMYSLRDYVKEGKSVFYAYYNPSIKYDKTKSDSVHLYPVDLDTQLPIYEKVNDTGYVTHFYDYRQRGQKYFWVNAPSLEFTNIILDVYYKRNKIKKINTRGIIAYLPFYNAVSTDYLGLVGIGCFVFK